jgi:DNA replication protein DnaC
MTPEEIERFWKMGLVQSMNSVSPGFVIDERNQKLISEIYLWVWAWMGRKDRGKLDPNKGLLLWGDIGTGKTTIIKGLQKYLAAINELAYGCNNRSICFEIKSAAEISLRYSADGMKAMERWTEREQAGHLAIDEIGRESVSNHFGTPCNTIQTILQLRYELRHRIITHATTNIDMSGTEFSERYGTYIYDRLKEMFNIIHVGGKSRRI